MVDNLFLLRSLGRVSRKSPRSLLTKSNKTLACFYWSFYLTNQDRWGPSLSKTFPFAEGGRERSFEKPCKCYLGTPFHCAGLRRWTRLLSQRRESPHAPRSLSTPERPSTGAPISMVPADHTLESTCTLWEEGNLSNLQPEYLTAQPSNLSSLDPLMIAGTEAERQKRKQFNQGSWS